MKSNKKEPQRDEALYKQFFSKITFLLWINLMSLITMRGTDSEWANYFFGAIFLLSSVILSRRLSREGFNSNRLW